MSDFVHTIELSSNDFETEDLTPLRLRGREAEGELFAFEVELASRREDQPIARADEVIGASAQLTFDGEDGSVLRRIHGLVSWARYEDGARGQRGVLALRIVPRLWRLTLFRTQEVFVGMSVPDIVRSKLERLGVPDLTTWNLVDDYPARELVVQYKESDWDFICRLCEHVGIALFFIQEEDGERLVFTDNDAGWEPSTAPLLFSAGGEQLGVTAMSSEAFGVPRVFAVKDYNYRTPDVDLSGVAQLEEGLPGGVIEYGTHHRTPTDAARMARVRMEEAACRRLIHRGESTLPSIHVGSLIGIDGHVTYDGESLRVVEVEHEASFGAGFAEREVSGYRNHFRCCPGDLPYRPARKTHRPNVPGIVSAIVQPGPQGEVGGIPHIDGDGRYFVRFHFDGTVHGAERASQPVRMAQPFVGEGNNGMHFPLQRGTEVLIAFIDGNPDRPIIVGAVPNAANPATIVNRQSGLNRIQTAQGISIQFGSKQ